MFTGLIWLWVGSSDGRVRVNTAMNLRVPTKSGSGYQEQIWRCSISTAHIGKRISVQGSIDIPCARLGGGTGAGQKPEQRYNLLAVAGPGNSRICALPEVQAAPKRNWHVLSKE
jgi:hypothetical protein